jgi:hypothetical protein
MVLLDFEIYFEALDLITIIYQIIYVFLDKVKFFGLDQWILMCSNI